MPIGDLNKRITIQYPTKVSDGMGGYTETWVDFDTVWAKKTTHRSDEAIQDMKNTGTLTHNWRIRYREGIRSSWRIKYGSVYMAIVGPPIEKDEGPGRRWSDITAIETG